MASLPSYLQPTADPPMLLFLRNKSMPLLRWIWRMVLAQPPQEPIESQWQQMLEERRLLKRRIVGENKRTIALVEQVQDEKLLQEWFEVWKEAMQDLTGQLKQKQTLENMQEIADFLLSMNNDLADLLRSHSDIP